MGFGWYPMMLTPIKKQGDEHLSVWLIMCVTDCRIADWTGLALLSICSLVRKTTQDKRDYEEQECERSVSEDYWNAKIGRKRRLVENECRSPEGTKFRRMN